MAKPNKLPEWDTTEVNAIEPDQTHKDEGWIAPGGVPEKPPYQTFNYWQNEVYKWLKEINTKGVLGYTDDVDYVANESYSVGSDGFLYRCEINNGPSSSVVDPVGDLTGTWEITEVVQATETVAGKAEIATQPETNAVADDQKFVTPLKLGGAVGISNSPLIKTALNAAGAAPIFACRAWVNFNGTGVVSIRDSGNVSSITDNNTGDYTINFITPMEDANYIMNGSAGIGNGRIVVEYDGVSTITNDSTGQHLVGSCRIAFTATAPVSFLDDAGIYVSFFR